MCSKYLAKKTPSRHQSQPSIRKRGQRRSQQRRSLLVPMLDTKVQKEATNQSSSRRSHSSQRPHPGHGKKDVKPSESLVSPSKPSSDSLKSPHTKHSPRVRADTGSASKKQFKKSEESTPLQNDLDQCSANVKDEPSANDKLTLIMPKKEVRL